MYVYLVDLLIIVERVVGPRIVRLIRIRFALIQVETAMTHGILCS